MEDEEQIEAIKHWWSENGRSVIVVIVLVVVGVIGWQQYWRWSEAKMEMAADAWQMVRFRLESDDPTQVAEGRELAESLKVAHSNTIYARFAAMRLAAFDVANGDLDDAEQELRWIIAEEGIHSELGQLIQLRLARVLASKGDESTAMAMLNSDNSAYTAAYAIARGDIHLAASRQREALDAYLEARIAMGSLDTLPELLDAKIASLKSRLTSDDDTNEKMVIEISDEVES